MSGLRRLERLAPLLGLLVGAAILLVGLGRHGIWDPTELAFAKSLSARTALEGVPRLHGRLVRLGFELFGRRDWPGRFFGASAAWFASVAALELARRHRDARSGAYAAILAVATPLVVLNARWMVGDGPTIGLHALLGLGLFVAAFDRTDGESVAAPSTATRVLGLALAIAASALLVQFRGALLGVLPPVLAIAGVAMVDPSRTPSGWTRLTIGIVGGVLVAFTAYFVVRDAAGFSAFLGGVPGGEAPPSFEHVLQIAFHTLAPVSPLFVLGAARTVSVDDADPVAVERQRLRLGLVLWAAFAFGTSTLFASRYGTPTFLAVVPVAVLAALTLREAETDRALSLTDLLVFAMLVGLLFRDYALYPASPLAGVPVTAPTLAPGFQPKRAWALLFAAVFVTVGFGGAARFVDGRPFRTIVDPLRRAWNWATSTPTGIVLFIVLGAVELGILVLGAFGPAMHLPSIVSRIARPLAVALPLAPPLAVLATLALLHAFSRLGSARMVPTVLAIAAFGAYVQGPFLVRLSGDLSPRDLFTTFNEVRGPNESLARFEVRSDAFEYYIDGPSIELASRRALVEHLAAGAPNRNWAMFRRSILPQIDREVRARSGHHVILVDARNEEFVLATNRPVAGRTDQNPLARAVLSAASAHPEHPLAIRFRDLELIGYDLELPGTTSVGAGQPFRVTWYWKCVQRTTIDWKIFLHIDGQGLRLNGDHDPVEGLLPTSQWSVGDVVRDTQELSVPASYPASDFTMYIGLFSGNDRMPIVSGPDGGENRGIAGTLRVR